MPRYDGETNFVAIVVVAAVAAGSLPCGAYHRLLTE